MGYVAPYSKRERLRQRQRTGKGKGKGENMGESKERKKKNGGRGVEIMEWGLRENVIESCSEDQKLTWAPGSSRDHNVRVFPVTVQFALFMVMCLSSSFYSSTVVFGPSPLCFSPELDMYIIFLPSLQLYACFSQFPISHEISSHAMFRPVYPKRTETWFVA